MTGTKQGAKKAAKTTAKRHGVEFFKKVGRAGGRKSQGPFAKDHRLASRAGAKSKRRK